MNRSTCRARSLVAVVAITFGAAACATSGDASADRSTTSTTKATTTTETSTTTEVDPLEGYMIGDKTILLDGFLGVEIPEGWGVDTARPLEASFTPEGGETELDPGALAQVLVINTDDDPRAGTFAVLHYEHSPAVPDLDTFSSAVVEALSADGSTITAPQTSRLGGQEARLHQLNSAGGATGLMVTFVSSGDYFVVLALINDPELSEDTAGLVGSLSFDPAALPG